MLPLPYQRGSGWPSARNGVNIARPVGKQAVILNVIKPLKKVATASAARVARPEAAFGTPSLI